MQKVHHLSFYEGDLNPSWYPWGPLGYWPVCITNKQTKWI